MKIKAIICLAAVMSVLLCGCGNNVVSTDVNSSSADSTSSTQAETTKTEESSEPADINTLIESDMPQLVEKSEYFYSVYLRCRIETEEYDESAVEPDENGFRYVPVTAYPSVDEMKADTEKYFTKTGVDTLFYSVALTVIFPTIRKTAES